MRGKQIVQPVGGDVRTIRRFLFFPKLLPLNAGRRVWQRRWLEVAHIRQEYHAGTFCKGVWAGDRWIEVP